jgi:hypothetical protein
MECAQDILDIPLLKAFESISAKYVDNASDMDGDGKRAWKGRLAKLASILREEKGTKDTRSNLREMYNEIVDKMKDGDLTQAELGPHEKKLDLLLEQVETEEVQKKE